MKNLIIALYAANVLSCNGQNLEYNSLKVYTSINEAINVSDSVYVLKLTNNNYAETIPSEIIQFKNLIKLSFTGNDCDMANIKCKNIDSLPNEICNLKNLKELLLVNNRLKKVPNCLNRINLKTLDLSDNPEINLDNIVKINSLEELSLNGCYLKQLPVEITNLKKLKILGLSNNDFSDEEKRRVETILPKVKIYW